MSISWRGNGHRLFASGWTRDTTSEHAALSEGFQSGFAPQFLVPAAAVSPSMAQEVAFISGVNVDHVLVSPSYGTWARNSPATYGNSSKTAIWGSGSPGTGGVTVSYWFDSASAWTATEKQAFVAGFTLWSDVANIHFTAASSAAGAGITITRGAAGSGAVTNTSSSGTQGAGTVGGSNLWHMSSAKISIDTHQAGFGPITANPGQAGGSVWETILHEEGHALGLGHGGPYNEEVNLAAQFSAYDSRLWTVMSYIAPASIGAAYFGQYTVKGTSWGRSADGFARTANSIMPLDILAAQALYGQATQSGLGGGQVFGFHCNIADATKAFFDFTVNKDPVITLWDMGTGNTLDLSGYATASNVNLNPGTFSSCDGMVNNVGIAQATKIDSFVGGSGNDTVTGNDDGDTITLGAGNDNATGGTGADVFNYAAANLSSGDTVNGGTGAALDRFVFTTAGATAADAFANVSHIEVIALNLGGNAVTVTDGLASSSDTGVLTINGSRGSDSVDATGVVTAADKIAFNPGSGADSFKGGVEFDTFNFTAADLTSLDTVSGGVGSTDTLVLTTAGALAADAFANVSHIEALKLAAGGNSLTLTSAAVTTADDRGVLTITGSAVNDTVDASAVGATGRVVFVAGAGDDTFTGGAGADVVEFTVANLTATDVVNGGTGTAIDRLAFLSAGSISNSVFANVSHIEMISLARGANSITLSNALVASADDNHLLTVLGSSGNDTINARAVTTATNSVKFQGGLGADSLTASAGHDIFVYTGVGDSNGNAYDTISLFNTAADRIDLPFAIANAAGSTLTSLTARTISSASFDTDLANALNVDHLPAHDAVLVHAVAGTLANHLFLVVDANGSAGYQSGADYVIDVTGAAGTFTASDFI